MRIAGSVGVEAENYLNVGSRPLAAGIGEERYARAGARVIARVGRGWTATEDADAYLEYLAATGMKDSRATPGNRGTLVLGRTDGARTEFTTVTFWDSLAAIEAFAGPEVEKAIFYPDDERFLVERELSVAHHEVVHANLGVGSIAAG